MTMLSRLGFIPNRQNMIKSTFLSNTNQITLIIPVKNNQCGINLFLEEFFKTHTPKTFPQEIIIVDNNSEPEIILPQDIFPISVKLLKHKNIGPASARNYGVKFSKSEWILFTDSDCVPTSTLLTGYLPIQNGALGYAGNIKSYKSGIFSQYYESQEILVPPKVYEEPNKERPDYLITANCLVWKPAFEKIGGFNEEIKIAGGEDVDLGFKLRNIGQLEYAHQSIAKHNFEESFHDFKSRFIRYGVGNKIISEHYNLNLTPKPFKPQKKIVINYCLAYLQFWYLKKGYNLKHLHVK